MTLSETTNEVITLATAIRDYWDTELPKRHPNYPLVSPGEDDGPPPPEKQKLRDLLESVPADVVYKLAVLVSLGEGAVRTDDLAGHYEKLKKRFGTPDRAIWQLIENAALADEMTDGLDKLKHSGIDLDQLTFAPVTLSS